MVILKVGSIASRWDHDTDLSSLQQQDENAPKDLSMIQDQGLQRLSRQLHKEVERVFPSHVIAPT